MSTVDFQAQKCPTPRELQDFVIGDISDAELCRIETHLTDCGICEQRLGELDTHADGLVDSLKGLSPDRGVGSGTDNGEVADILSRFDTGRHYSRQLKKGPCRVGRFELIEEVGAGSFGYVFRARDTKLGRDVALKIQRAASIASDTESKRFLREARTVAAINHPAIVAIHEMGYTDDGVGFLVTEFVEGETLEQRLGDKRMDFRETAAFVAQLAQALHYAHDHGVVHRDVKPSNILIDIAGRPHITDFGLAKLESVEASVTTDGRIMGTPAYMSPEQARGESVNARTDIYSLGVILYEMLTGERPFHGTKRLMLLQVIEDEPRRPRQLDERIPKDLETICLKAMSKSPARRYQSAEEFAEDLRRFLKGEPIQARPLGYTQRLWRWCRRYPMAATVFFSLLIGSIAGIGYIAHLSEYFVHETALRSARIEADMLEEMNATYSDAVARIDPDEVEIEITHEYLHKPNTMPLPATLMIEAGRRISRRESGMQVRLVSDTPFRNEARPRTAFEQNSIEKLSLRAKEKDSNLEHYQFVTINDRPYLKYSRGQLMKKSCVECHNEHPKTPKNDWEEGDLAGVLSVTRPLDAEIASINSGFRGALFLMGGIVVLLVLGMLVIGIRLRWHGVK